jgi:hypothetical protein
MANNNVWKTIPDSNKTKTTNHNVVSVNEYINPRQQDLDNNQQRTSNDQQRTSNYQQRTGNDQQRTGNYQQRTGNDQQRTGNDQQRTGNDQQRTGNYQQRTGNDQQRTGNYQQRTGNDQQRTGNDQQRTGNYQQRTGNYQQRTGNYQQRTGNDQQRTGNYQQRTGNYQQRTGNDQQRTGNDQQNEERVVNFKIYLPDAIKKKLYPEDYLQKEKKVVAVEEPIKKPIFVDKRNENKKKKKILENTKGTKDFYLAKYPGLIWCDHPLCKELNLSWGTLEMSNGSFRGTINGESYPKYTGTGSKRKCIGILDVWHKTKDGKTRMETGMKQNIKQIFKNLRSETTHAAFLPVHEELGSTKERWMIYYIVTPEDSEKVAKFGGFHKLSTIMTAQDKDDIENLGVCFDKFDEGEDTVDNLLKEKEKTVEDYYHPEFIPWNDIDSETGNYIDLEDDDSSVDTDVTLVV